MQILSLSELKALVLNGEASDILAHAQVDLLVTKTTKDGKPYYEIHFIDFHERITLRAWSDAPVYALCAALEKGHCVEINGDFSHHATYGLDARRWTLRPLKDHEHAAFMAGPKETRERQETDFQFIAETVQSLVDPRLRILCEMFLVENGERFRRTAAARSYHHARRGGLVEHTAQMMRSACAVAGVYQRLNRDLLVAGVLFHDAGKLWENHVPEHGFGIEHCERGELLGHISMGIEIVNNLWRQLKANDAFAAWKTLDPPSESVRLHLLHLIASHHGEMSFGSPVLPKTPEACALHYIDNLDAKMEMVFNAYATAPLVAPHIYDRVRPLPSYLIEPLKEFVPESDNHGGWMAEPANG
jgi:3'-5' exoribonuclease